MLGPEEVTAALVNDQETASYDLPDKYGIIPRAIFLVFDLVAERAKECTECSIKCSYIEVYNEIINDLQGGSTGQNLRIREFPRIGMCVIGATERIVTNPDDVFECLAEGTKHRITCATEQNSRSSRSHTLFALTLEQKMLNGSVKQSKLNLIDLAGSEKVSKTGASGKALIEAQNINLSLTTLGRCIKALSSRKNEHIPFRESKLTMILRESLGGNAKTALVCTTSAKVFHVEESLGTLKFAERAKKVTVKAKSNLRQSPEELEIVIEQLKQEVTILRQQLHDKDDVGIPGPLDSYNELSIKFAELKAQYDNLTEMSQLEVERLRLRVEQLSALEAPVSYKEELQGQADQLLEANSMIAALREENDILQRRFEEEIVTVRQKMENAEREGAVMRGENLRLAAELSELRKELSIKEMEALQLQQNISLADSALKSSTLQQQELQHRLELAASEHDKLLASKEALEATEGTLRAEIATLHESLVNTQGELSLATSQFEMCKKSILLQSAELEATRSQLSEAKKTIIDLNSQLTSADLVSSQRLQQHQETVSALSLQIREMEGRNEALQSALSTFRSPQSTPATTDAVKEVRKKSKKTKIVVSRLLQELTDLKTSYNDTQRRFKSEMYEIRQHGEEKLVRMEKSLKECQKRLEIEMEENSKASKGLKLTSIELDSVQFHLKMTKEELTATKTALAEERFAHKSLQEDFATFLQELEALKRFSKAQGDSLEKNSAEAKRHILELQQTYKETLNGHQNLIKRLTDENSHMAGLISEKECELRDLDTLERNMESQLSTSLLTIQKLDHALKQLRNVSATQRNRNAGNSTVGTRSTFIPRVAHDSRVAFQSMTGLAEESKARYKESYSRKDVMSLYSVDVETERVTNLDTLEDDQIGADS